MFTSIHIEEFECVARDTKLGKEEITRDIPNVGEEALKDLDESGIVRIGAEVKPGDILVGKITPKGETQLSPKRSCCARSSARRPATCATARCSGAAGRAGHRHQRARVFSRKGTEKDERARDIEDQERARSRRPATKRPRSPDSFFRRKIRSAVGKDHHAASWSTTRARCCSRRATSSTRPRSTTVPRKYWGEIAVEKNADESVQQKLRDLEEIVRAREEHFREKIERLKKGDELPPGVIKMVKVYVAIKRKLQVGDKMAGRHGNKGVVSRILPEEDMPYLQDGTPVDIVLNPLGVPSRMNVGQILETHLGWAALRRRASRSRVHRREVRERSSRAPAQEIFARRRRAMTTFFEQALRTTSVRTLAAQKLAAASSSRRRCSTAPTRPRSRPRSRWRGCPSAVRRSCSTAAPASRSSRTSRSASCTC